MTGLTAERNFSDFEFETVPANALAASSPPVLPSFAARSATSGSLISTPG